MDYRLQLLAITVSLSAPAAACGSKEPSSGPFEAPDVNGGTESQGEESGGESGDGGPDGGEDPDGSQESSTSTPGDSSSDDGRSGASEDTSGANDGTGRVEECGDGVRNLTEDCDGNDLDGNTCTTHGFAGGTLLCTDCTFDTSACEETVAQCSDGLLDDSELCDGDQLGGATCASEGFVTGTLACGNDCNSFLTGGCSMYSGSCCNEDGNPTPGCEDPVCTEDVCARAPSCCEGPWIDLCAELAANYCGFGLYCLVPL